MASSDNKYYVVWIGLNPGIYNTWEECKNQVEGWKGAVYKGFKTKEQAEEALMSPPELYMEKKDQKGRKQTQERILPPEVIRQAMAVDAACSGNPGQMEYRGVYLADMQEKFHFGPIKGTNNIGEFLAIVHCLALYKQRGLDWPLYSDSRNAILWVRQKKCKTKLEYNESTKAVFERIEAAERWLQQNSFRNPIIKWETDKWGEIPADFGRK